MSFRDFIKCVHPAGPKLAPLFPSLLPIGMTHIRSPLKTKRHNGCHSAAKHTHTLMLQAHTHTQYKDRGEISFCNTSRCVYDRKSVLYYYRDMTCPCKTEERLSSFPGTRIWRGRLKWLWKENYRNYTDSKKKKRKFRGTTRTLSLPSTTHRSVMAHKGHLWSVYRKEDTVC